MKMKLFKFASIIVLAVLGLSGCAQVTPGEQMAAEKHLKSSCLQAYVSSRTNVSSDGFGYQYWRYKPRAFAAANYGDQQVCGWYAGGWGDDRNNINQLAVQSCNKYLPAGLTCGLFAVDDSIVGVPPSHTIYQDHKQSTPKNLSSHQVGIDEAKSKCKDLGIKSGTEAFGRCVLQLSK